MTYRLQMMALKLISTFAVMLIPTLFTGCEPEVGMECSTEPSVISDFPKPEGGEEVLQQSVDFDNCSKAFCMRKDDSRPYCTRRCETDLDCEADGFVCIDTEQFGSLGCPDYKSTNNCTESQSRYKYCVAEEGTLEARDK